MNHTTRWPARGEYVGKNERQIADVLARSMQGGNWNVECVVEGRIVDAVITWDNITNRWERVER